MFRLAYPTLIQTRSSIRPLLLSTNRPIVRHSSAASSAESTHANGIVPVAVITGASRGIGRAIALQLARDGYDVALNDLPSNQMQLEGLSSEIIEQVGRRALVIPGDVSVEGDVRSLVDASTKTFGRLDVMVANAGIAVMEPLLQNKIEDWDRVIAVNLRGVYLCYKYAAQQMIEQGRGGRIIGASSVLGKVGNVAGIPLLGAYSAAKSGVRSLTQTAAGADDVIVLTVAQEWAQYGITVNAYAPGPVETDMRKPLPSFITPQEKQQTAENLHTVRGISLIPDEVIREAAERRMTKTDLGYLGTPEDIAGLVSFLASEKGRFITGQAVRHFITHIFIPRVSSLLFTFPFTDYD
ncbi:Short-chain dehydrogenase [Psilocybe cubensis]|uniref:Short-chain dehydrogenase n=1 Tax=Psilocybe cubensis TaxID=181762 RepID=A0ACB8GVQ2_PSICU|nr:Short-chain dehydrogenase [Psilocybe cubensis]KAH9479104.1 Short-chain dehydrogenase [Psilocybe cubensis]